MLFGSLQVLPGNRAWESTGTSTAPVLLCMAGGLLRSCWVPSTPTPGINRGNVPVP